MTTLKTVAARIRSSEADYDKDAEDFEGLAESASKYRKEIMALSGVDIMENENTYKSTFQIFKELGKVWNQMTDISQAALAERLGGKRNMNVIMSIIQNIDDLTGAYEDSITAAGTAAEANEIYMDSISGKMGQFKAQWDVFSSTALDSNMVKPIIGGATQLLSVLTGIVKVLGQLGPLITVPATLAAGKGFYNLAKDLSTTEGVIGVLSKKFVGLGDSIKSGFNAVKSSTFVGALKNAMTVAPGAVVAAGGAVVAGMALLGVAAYEAYQHSFTGRFNKFKQDLAKSEQLERDASSYDAQVKSNVERIDALKQVKDSTNGLTAAEAAELKMLESQTSELLRQKSIKDSLAETARAGTASSAYDALTTPRWTTEAPVAGSQDHYDLHSRTLEASITADTKSYKAYLKAREEASKKMEELIKTGKKDSSQYVSWEQRFSETDQKAAEIGNRLSADLNTATSLSNALDRSTSAGERVGAGIDTAINKGWRAINEGSGKTAFDTMDTLVGSGLFKEANSGLSVLGELGSVGVKDIEKYRKKYSEFNQALRDGGITSKEAAAYYKDMSKQTGTLGGSVDSAGSILKHYSEQLQTVETNIGTLDQATTKLSSGDFSLTDLSSLEGIFSGISDGVDPTTFEGLASNITEARKHVADSLLEQLDNMRSQVHTKEAREQIDIVTDAVKRLGDASETTTKLYGGIGRVIEEVNGSAKETSDLLSGGEPNASYTIYSDAIKQLKEYKRVGMRGAGQTKNWKLAAALFGEDDFGNVTAKNAEKKRKELDSRLKKWDSAFSNTDSKGNLTNVGAKEFLNTLNNDSEFKKRISAMGDAFKYENGEWTIQIDESHLPFYADVVGLSENAFKSGLTQESQFLDIDWNKNNRKDYVAALENGYEIAGKKIDIKYEDLIKGAEKLGISTSDYVDELSSRFGRDVVVIDGDLKRVSKKQIRKDEKNRKKAKKAIDDAASHFLGEEQEPSKNTDRHQGRKKEPPKDAWAYDKGSKGTQDKDRRTFKKGNGEEVEVTVDADTSKAEKKTKEAKKKAEKNDKPDLTPTVDMSKTKEPLEKAKEEAEKNIPDLKMEPDIDVPKVLDKASDNAGKNIPKLSMDVDTSGADDKVKKAKDNWEKIDNPEVKVDADTTEADEKTKRLHDNWEKIDNPKVKVDADTSKADSEVEKSKNKAKENPPEVPVEVNTVNVDHALDEAKKSGERGLVVNVDANTKPAEKKIEKLGKPEEHSDRHQGRQHESEQVVRESHYKSTASQAPIKTVGSVVSATVDKIKNGSNNNSMTVDANTSPAQQKINALIQQIEGRTYKLNVDTGDGGASASTESAVKAASGLAGKISGVLKNKTVKISADVSGTKEVDKLKTSTDKVKPKKVEVKATPKGEPGVKGLHKSVEQVKPKKVDVKANSKGEREVKSLKGSIDRVEGKSVTVKANTTGTGLVDALVSKIAQVKDKKVTITTEHRTVDKKIYSEGAKRRKSNQGGGGTSKLRGTAFKSGTWGAKSSGRALGGEVGRRVLRPRIAICV